MFNPSSNEIETLIPGVSNVSLLEIGGQKIVFRSQHSSYGDVVIKFFLDTNADERIRREIEISTNYDIPNVPKLHEWKEIIDEKGNSIIYLIEEFIDGETLYKYLQRVEKLPLQHGIELLRSLITTAIILESNDLVHRDIKPLNIMVRRDNTFCLLDFGIARHLKKPSITYTQAPYGPHSIGYSAPEQFRNLKKDIDIRADLFSIGVVAYEAITGIHPFNDGNCNPLEVLRRTETINPTHVVIEGDTQRQLMGLLDAMMQKFPSRRPPDARTALDWLQSLLPTLN